VDARVFDPKPGGIHLSEQPEFRLGAASVDPAAHEVRFAGGVERIQAQPMRVLVALAQAKGKLLTRQAITERCWDGRIVGDDVINRAILILRGAGKRSGAFEIETIPREGYRLVIAAAGGETGHDRKRWVSISVGAAALASIAAWTFVPREAAPTSVTVLPIVSHVAGQTNLSAEIRATMIHALMNSGFVVEGEGGAATGKRADYLIRSEINGSDGRIRAGVQMEDLRHGMIILSRQFDRPQASSGAIADEIAATVAANIAGIAAPMSLERRQPVSPAILSNFLNLIYLHGTQADPLRAYKIARDMLPQAPNSAITQVSLAVSTGFVLGELPEGDRPDALAKGRAAAAEGERLAPDFGDNAVAWCLLHPHAEFAACEIRLQKAMRSGGDAPTVPLALSVLQLETGQFEDARQLAEMASAADPYNPIKRDFLIQALEIARLDKDAEAATARGQRWWPDHQAFTWNRVMGLSALGDFAGIERVDQSTPADLIPYDREVVRIVLSAVRGRDLPAMRRACLKPDLRGSTRQVCMAGLIRLGDLDSAFAVADVLYPRTWGRTPRETEAMWLKQPEVFPLTFLSSPAAASMRGDPRFKGVAGRTGLLAYWDHRRPDFCRSEDCSALLTPVR
jgi:DNA-binding winged helix-turn-helix (wHTH) protein/TolB-like protein